MKTPTRVAVISALVVGLSASGFADAARLGNGGGHRGGGSHFSGGGAHYSGGGYRGGRGYYGGGYRGGYGVALGLGLLGAAIAAPIIAAPYYSQPYGYAPAYPQAGYAPGYAYEQQQYAPQTNGAYFCRSYNAYYPQVSQCPEGWQAVAPQQQQYRPY